MVMASGLDTFKRGLDRFLEEKSITGYKPLWGCIISRFKRKVLQNARCRGVGSGDRDLVVSCAPRGIWWGHCKIQGAGLDGPLVWSSRALLLSLFPSSHFANSSPNIAIQQGHNYLFVCLQYNVCLAKYWNFLAVTILATANSHEKRQKFYIYLND